MLRDRDGDTAWNAASDGTMEERVYYAQNWRHDVSALITSAGQMVEWVKYSSYGVPWSLPAADTDSDGDFDATDSAAITGTYDVRKDVNLDGTIDVTDLLDAFDLNNGYVNQGWSKLGLTKWGNRKGYAGYEGDTALAGTKWHVRHRVLESELGRWLSRDPIGYTSVPPTLIQYSSSPLQITDSYGLYTNAFFTARYLSRLGGSENLDDLGLLDAYKNHPAIAPRVFAYETLMTLRARKDAISLFARINCGCNESPRILESEFTDNRVMSISEREFVLGPNGFTTIADFANWFSFVDWTYSIGGHRLNVNTKCSMIATCSDLTTMPPSFSFVCTFNWKMRDRFTDPLSIHEAWRMYVKYKLGGVTPPDFGETFPDMFVQQAADFLGKAYNINGDWTTVKHGDYLGSKDIKPCSGER